MIAMQILTGVAGVGELSGMWITGNKNRWGFMIGLIGTVCWYTFALYGASYIVWPLVVTCLASAVIYTRNFIRWSRLKKETP